MTCALVRNARAPLRESAYRLGMRAHAVAGNRAEALRTYQQLRLRLAEELGVDPTPETETAYVEVLGFASGGTPEAGPRARQGPDEPVPFVDRRAELARLADAWAMTTGSRRARVALVLGEAGIGKSRLVGEAARRIAAEGGMVLFGRCEADSGIAFQPLAEVLANLLAVLPADELPPLDPAARRDLAAAFPNLDGITLPATPGTGQQVDRARLSAGVFALLDGVAQRRPLFVVLDDLQWIEADTVVVLLHLIAELSQTPLLAVALVRDPPTPSDMFHSTMHNLERTIDVERIDLRGLDEEDARTLVAALHPKAGPQTASVARRLWTATSGNPFMLLELIHEERRAAAAGADGPTRLGHPGAVPQGITDLVEAKLRALTLGARDLLRAAAVVGRSFDVDVAAEAAALDPSAALDGLDWALDAGLIHEVGPDRYRFSHDIVQRTLYDQLSGARRRALHARCADALEALRADVLDEHAAALARHSLAAASARHRDLRAVEWACTAARQAGEWGAHAEARRLYAAALGQVPPNEARLHADVATDLGLAEQVLDEPAAGRTLLDAAARARACGHRTAAARAALGLAELSRRRPELRSPTTALLADLAALPPPSSPHEDSVGASGDQRDVDDEAVLWGQVVARAAALDVVAAPGPASELGIAAAALARHLSLLTGPARLAERRAAAEDLSALAEVADNDPSRRVAAHHRAMAAALLGETEVVDSVLASPGATDDATVRALDDERAVAVAVTEGRFDEARARAETLHRSSDPGSGAGQGTETPVGVDAPGLDIPTVELGSAPPGTLARRQLLVADWLQGRLQERTNGAAGEVHPTEQALIHVAVGETGRAQLLVHTLLADDATARADSDVWLHDVGVLALAGARLGDPETAAAIQTLLSPYAELSCGAGYRSFVGTARFHLGCLATVVGDWADAERNLAAALNDATRRRARPWTALAQATLADVLDHRGRSSDRDLAATLRSEAHWTAQQLGLAVIPT